MRLPDQLPLEQAQAQIVAQVPVAELAQLRVLVQAAVLELAQEQTQRLVQELELELALGLQLERELPLVWVREPPVVWVLEPLQVLEQIRQQEPAVEPEQVRELRVSRQLEPQQNRLQAAAQELLPCRPVLPMKAPCWGVPA